MVRKVECNGVPGFGIFDNKRNKKMIGFIPLDPKRKADNKKLDFTSASELDIICHKQPRDVIKAMASLPYDDLE